MLNSVSVNGRLTREPELRFTPSGTAVCNFNVAVQRDYKDDNGERPADFPDVVVWGPQAESTANFVKKGHLVGVQGRLETRRYENSEGQMVYVTEINASQVYFLEPKAQTEPSTDANPGRQQNQRQQGQRQGGNNRSTGRTTGNRSNNNF